MKHIISIIRPKQWLKNLFVLMPLFFGGALFQGQLLLAGLCAMLAFCFASSSIYCLNDLIDCEADRHHPVKCHRPIAAGTVSATQARLLMVIMALLSAVALLPLWLLPGRDPHAAAATSLVVLAYWLMNIAYCLRLKQLAIADVTCIAVGFILRLLAGSKATGMVLSQWIVLMTFLLTLFLSLAKRRDDVLLMNATGEAPRKNTSRYSLTFINQSVTIVAAVTLVCYIMYTLSPEVISRLHTKYLYLTTIFVLIGLLRYLQLTVVDQKSGDPTRIALSDRFTQAVVLAWGLSFFVMLYLL